MSAVFTEEPLLSFHRFSNCHRQLFQGSWESYRICSFPLSWAQNNTYLNPGLHSIITNFTPKACHATTPFEHDSEWK
jgi:hypothetical protein